MLPPIDPGTLYLASAVVFLGLVVSVGLSFRELREMAGPDRFLKGYALLVVGIGSLAFRGRIPDVLSITAANVLIVLGAAFILEGTRLFYGLGAGRALTAALGISGTALFGFLTFVRPSADARAILSNGILSALFAAAGWTSIRKGSRSESRLLDRVTAGAFTVCGVLFGIRGLMVATGYAGGGLMDANPVSALAPLVGTVSAVVWTTTLLTNAHQRLRNVVRAQNDLLASLLAVVRVAGDASNLDAALKSVLDAARSVTRSRASSLLLLDVQGRFTRGLFSDSEAASDIGREMAGEVLQDGLAGWVARERKAAVVHDVLEDPRWRQLPDRGGAVRSALSAPIATGSALVGVLTLVHSEPGWFDDEQRRLIESVAAQIALVLRNAQIADARHRATRSEALINQILEISVRLSDAEGIAAESAAAIEQATGWGRVVVALPGEDGRFRLHGRTEGLADPRPGIGSGLLARAFATGRTCLDDEGAGGRQLVVPLRQPGRILGVASFESPPGKAIGPEDVALGESVADAVSLGLGKAGLAEAREELTRALVHDLRGPVVGILGAVELLRAAPGLGEAEGRLLDMAERNARRQADLISGILELAKLEDGALPVRRAGTPVGELVEDVLRLERPLAETRKLTLVALIPADLPRAWVDRDLIGRVLENLVGNAIKFSEAEAGPVEVSARASGSFVELRVRDSGPGVEEAVRPKLFHKFAAGSHRGRGSGLGLAFCRLAVEANGGRIWLEHPGPGAVFAFSIPVAASPS